MRDFWSSGRASDAADFAESAVHPFTPALQQSHRLQHLTAALSGVFAQKIGRGTQHRRPRLTICRDFGPATIGMVMRRSLIPYNLLLLCLKQLLPTPGGLHRFVLAGVDAVLVETDAVAHRVLQLGVSASKIVTLCDPDDLTLFTQQPRSRSYGNTYRIIHVGDLEPEAGVAELLSCVSAWAYRNPGHSIEIFWAGEGCFQGILDAQPLPANVSQQFAGTVSREELARMFHKCDLLAVPALSDPWTDLVLEAVTAQLPVLGSNRSRRVTQLVTHGVTGWVFDPFKAGAMEHAVELALGASPQELEYMRARAAIISHQPHPGLNERLRRILRIEDAELPSNLARIMHEGG